MSYYCNNVNVELNLSTIYHNNKKYVGIVISFLITNVILFEGLLIIVRSLFISQSQNHHKLSDIKIYRTINTRGL